MSYRVKDYMRRDIVTVDIESSAVDASKLMLEKEVGCLIVLKNDQLAGIVTERDLVSRVMAKEKDPSKTPVSDFMSAPLITIDVDSSLEDAVKTMVEHGIRRLPVVHDNIIYGVFTARDLAKHFNEYEDRVTKDIIRSMSFISLPF